MSPYESVKKTPVTPCPRDVRDVCLQQSTFNVSFHGLSISRYISILYGTTNGQVTVQAQREMLPEQPASRRLSLMFTGLEMLKKKTHVAHL